MDETSTPEVKTEESKNTTMFVIIAAVVIALGGVAFALRGSTPAPNTTPTEDITMTEETTLEDTEGLSPEAGSMDAGTTDTTATEGDVQIISVEAGAFYYKPDTITVKKGQKVKIEMKSADMMHDFIIDELEVKMPITQSGDTGVVEFTADTVGSFEYYCSVGQHKANGQVGTLIVEE